MGDYEIEKGTEIILITYMSHLSSDNYEDPRTFNPNRFLKDSDINKGDSLFMSFGLGPKACLGKF